MQVIYNLLSNSTKFSDIGGVIKVITYLDGNNFVFEINNHGRCIDAKHKNSLFKLFYQCSPSPRENYEGAGIGLALCKKIVMMHGGNIDFSSCKEDGTTFIFNLPINTHNVVIK